ncbi:MAG: hypothetical protein ACREX7_09415 [Casimicrobiaceae bacterium]
MPPLQAIDDSRIAGLSGGDLRNPHRDAAPWARSAGGRNTRSDSRFASGASGLPHQRAGLVVSDSLLFGVFLVLLILVLVLTLALVPLRLGLRRLALRLPRRRLRHRRRGRRAARFGCSFRRRPT